MQDQNQFLGSSNGGNATVCVLLTSEPRDRPPIIIIGMLKISLAVVTLQEGM